MTKAAAGAVFVRMSPVSLPLIVFVLPPIAFAFLRYKGAGILMFIAQWTILILRAIDVAGLWQLCYFAETSVTSIGAASVVLPLVLPYPLVTILGRVHPSERVSHKDGFDGSNDGS